MLASLPFALVQHVLTFSDATTTSAVMCSSRELRDAVSATMHQSQAIVFVRAPRVKDAPKREYGPTLKLWLHHYSPTVTSLSLRDCHFLTDEDCKLLATQFPLLERLDLSGCTNVTAAGVRRFSEGCKSLSHFRCDMTKVYTKSKTMRVTHGYISATAESKSLTTLSLTLGSRNKSSALAPLREHPALQELNLFLDGYYFVSLDIDLPALQRLRLYRGEWSTNSWRDFFQALRISGDNEGTGGSNGGNGGSNGGNGGNEPNLRNLPNLQFLHIQSEHSLLTMVPGDNALQQLLRPEVLAALPRSKLVSIVISPCTAEQLSQWQALGPLNSLGQPISLSTGEPWFKRV
ncbi:hypothetical protein B484DRAFT_424426 [Ochromonadaceae sp. CCMP2298]|nr:hypothetical protein B484DRAFT_424426 [Ochromonadaceae sp. CCMP2298]